MMPDPDTRQLGEYQLTDLLLDDHSTRLWVANQISISRKVLLCELKPEALGHREAFLSNARAKASCEHPLISSIFEAISSPTECFFTHEWLPGASLKDRLIANAPFSPLRLAQVIRSIADAYIYLESAQLASAPLSLSQVFIDDQGVIRISNPAIDGPRSIDQSTLDIEHLGQTLPPLNADSQSGSTRVATLLSWMRGEQVDAPLTWPQVHEVASQIIKQLTEPSSKGSETQHGNHLPQRALSNTTILTIAALLVGLVSVIYFTRPKTQSIHQKQIDPPTVQIPKNRYPTQEGASVSLPAFKIACNEVTIAQYADFLDTLTTLKASSQEKTYDHPDQPSSKTHHTPDDWDLLYATAKKGGSWKNHLVTLNHPVVGVDWWDAYAYAKWKHGRLPTHDEWFAVASLGGTNPKTIPASDWNDVTLTTTDTTTQKVNNMAGSVAEWTLLQAIDPTNPMGGLLQSVIVGGSYTNPQSKATDRYWLDDRSTRRPDLGFRLAFD